jgi:hypothetical protein
MIGFIDWEDQEQRHLRDMLRLADASRESDQRSTRRYIMCHTAQFEAAKKALEQFHQDSDIDALRTALFEIEIPAYCRREDFMEWILYGIEP